MKNILAIFFLFIAASSYALEIVTLDGKAFHDCEVKKVEREGIRISHRDGTAFLDFDQLPSALQSNTVGRQRSHLLAQQNERCRHCETESDEAARLTAVEAAKAAASERERKANMERLTEERSESLKRYEVEKKTRVSEAIEKAKKDEQARAELMAMCSSE